MRARSGLLEAPEYFAFVFCGIAKHKPPPEYSGAIVLRARSGLLEAPEYFAFAFCGIAKRKPQPGREFRG